MYLYLILDYGRDLTKGLVCPRQALYRLRLPSLPVKSFLQIQNQTDDDNYTANKCHSNDNQAYPDLGNFLQIVLFMWGQEVCMFHNMHVQIKEQLLGRWISLVSVCSRDQTQAIRPGIRYFYLLSHSTATLTLPLTSWEKYFNSVLCLRWWGKSWWTKASLSLNYIDGAGEMALLVKT